MSTLFTSELKEGMITLRDTFSSQGRLILPKDTVITKSIISKLLANSVLMVEIYDNPSKNGADEALFTHSSEYEEALRKTPEYKKFRSRYDKNVIIMSEHLNDIINKSASIEVDTLLNNALNIMDSASSPLSIFNMMSTMKNYDDSTFNHSLNVGLICNIMGKWLDFSEADIRMVTSCGLFHDIGKLLIPENILKKPGKLTPEEYEIIKAHTVKGYELLKSKKVDPHIQYAALMHHEKCDGSGYPLGLKGDKIDLFSQIVTIADVYEAMTAKRVYRDAINPFEVIYSFEINGLKKYNPHFLLTFLQRVVNSYVNCKVKLSNGEEGDIVYINMVNLSKPLVKTGNSFIDLSKNPEVSIDKVL